MSSVMTAAEQWEDVPRVEESSHDGGSTQNRVTSCVWLASTHAHKNARTHKPIQFAEERDCAVVNRSTEGDQRLNLERESKYKRHDCAEVSGGTDWKQISGLLVTKFVPTKKP